MQERIDALLSSLSIADQSQARRALLILVLGLSLLAVAMWMTSRILGDGLLAPLTVFLTAGFTGIAVIYFLQGRQESGRSSQRLGNQLEQHIRNGKRIIIHDPETTLLQRWYFELRVMEEVQRCNRYGIPMALVVIRAEQPLRPRDNESALAAEMGFVQLFAHALRSMDMAAKLGEREYVICLPHADEAGALAVAERLIRRRRENQFLLGMAVFPKEGQDLDTLLDRARRSLAAELPARLAGGNESRKRYAEILHAVSTEPSGQIPVEAGETARGLKVKLRRAAKRAGVELSIWERAGTIYYAHKAAVEQAA